MTRDFTSAIPYTEFTVATGNFDTLRQPISQIIIHSTAGTVSSAINTFGSLNSGVSANYIIGNDGSLWGGLEEKWTAYHAGNLDVNRRSIGIEHEWYPGIVISDALYKTSAKLVADICKFYGLGCNRGVIKGHREIVATSCPNLIDVDRIVREANLILNPPVVNDWEEYAHKLEEERDKLNKAIEKKDGDLKTLGLERDGYKLKLEQIKALIG